MQPIQQIEVQYPEGVEGWNIAEVPQKDGSPTVYFICNGYTEHGMTRDLEKARIAAEVLAGEDIEVPVVKYPPE